MHLNAAFKKKKHFIAYLKLLHRVTKISWFNGAYIS
jgi:hypothetical protein